MIQNELAVRRYQRLFLGILLVVASQLAGNVVFAQSADSTIDLEPPAIDHNSLETGRAGDAQTIVALVADDRGVKQVMLFYRNEPVGEYASVLMREIADTGKYTSTVSTESSQSMVQYYIEAIDTGGNRVLKGFPFYPLVRELTPPDPLTVANPIEPQAPPAEETGGSRILYVLLGVAALGLLAAAAGGGDGDSGGGGAELVPLNITVTPP